MGSPRKIDYKTFETIIAKYNSGKTLVALASEYNINPSGLRVRLIRNGIKTRSNRKITTSLDIENIILRYNSGMSLAALGRIYKVDSCTIHDILIRSDVKILPKGERSRKCTKCKKEINNTKELDQTSYKKGFWVCRKCESNRGRKQHKELRLRVIKEYGGKCQCKGCNEDKWEFLSIDHINGGGNKHRKIIGRSAIYRWLVKNNFPKDKFQLLCMNCNWSRGMYGYCPHEK